MTRRRSIRRWAVAAVIALTAAGCGGGNADKADTTDERDDSSPRSEKTVEPSDDTDDTTSAAPDPDAPATTVEDATGVAVTELAVPDPTIGLAGLTSYHQELTVELVGTRIAQTDTYVRDAWPGTATFTHLTTATEVVSTDLLVGDLLVATGPASGTTSVTRRGSDGACATRWAPATTSVAPSIEPARMLPPVLAMADVGVETVEGRAAHRYQVDVAVAGATGSGEIVLVDDSGLLVSYDATLTTGDVTNSYRYAVTSLDALPAPTLPVGCEPVLERIPTVDGATDVQRLPGALDYATTAAVSDVVAFHEQTLPALGWVLVTSQTTTSDRATLVFAEPASGASVSILVEVADGKTWVSALIRTAG